MKTIQLMLLLVLVICASCIQWRNRHQKDDVLEIINPVVKPNTHYTLFNQDTMFAYFDDSDLILRNKLDTFNFELDYATNNLYNFNIFYEGEKQGGLLVHPLSIDEKGNERLYLEVWFNDKGPLPFLRNEYTIFQPLE